MLVKKSRKTSIIIYFLIFILIFYYMMRVMTMVEKNGGNLQLECFMTSLNEIYKIFTPLSFTMKNISTSAGISLFILMFFESYKLQNKKNIQEDTYGSAEWVESNSIKDKKDDNFENNIILTQTEFISKNMKKSGMNRHILLLGRPGTR